MEVQLPVNSSRGGSHLVAVSLADGVLSVHCSCPAGTYRHWCKHKTAVLSGDHSILRDETEAEKLDQVATWVDSVGCLGAFRELHSAQKTIQDVEARIVQLKEDIIASGIVGLQPASQKSDKEERSEPRSEPVAGVDSSTGRRLCLPASSRC